MLNRLACVALVGASLTWGCSTEMRAEPAAEELAAAICDLGFRCCTEGELAYYMSPFVDAEDCTERLVYSTATAPAATFSIDPILGGAVSLPNLRALDRAIKDGRVRVNEGALAECVTLLRELTCNMQPEDPEEEDDEVCDPTLPEPPEGPSPCSLQQLVEGRVGEGERCTTDTGGFECRGDLVCLRWSSLGVEGACGAAQQLGDPCFGDGECAPDLHCSMVDGTCQELRQAGESCVYGETDEPIPSPALLQLRCDAGLTCSPFEETCVGPCARGYTCNTTDDCGDGLVCIQRVDSQGSLRSFCDAPHPEGGPCFEPEDCVEGLTCEGATFFAEGECTTARANGATCSDDHQCQSGICASWDGNCIAPRANGLDCGRDVECQSGFCHSFQCAPTAAPGDPCPTGNDAQCEGGECVLSGTYFEAGYSCDGPDDTICGTGVCDYDEVAETGSCIECTADEHCDTGLCDMEAQACLNACVALLADGESCILNSECMSGVCVHGECGTPPFPDGSPCSTDLQCESGVCNFGASPSVCITPPLANGQPCAAHDHCESRVCFEGSCQNGGGEGADCDGPFGAVRPCDPAHFFCDLEATNPTCTAIRETGEACDRNAECRSNNCTTRWSRLMCSPAPPPDRLICDGA